MLKILLSVLISVVLSACGTLDNLDQSARVEKNETVFVIGVSPANYRFAISPGEIKNHNFIQSVMLGVTTQAFPKDGYVISKTSGSYDLGWVSSSKYDKPGGDRADVNPRYTCIGDEGMAFHTAPGKVIYLADVEIKGEGSAQQHVYTSNF